MIYFDATYVVRCYLDEPGAAEVRALGAGRRIVCLALGQAEVAAAFHRKLREGALTVTEHTAVMCQFESDIAAETMVWPPLQSALLHLLRQTFAALPHTVFLRSADALHLLCAREAGLDEVYTNDRHMLAAATHFGLRGVNVISMGSA